MSNSCRYSSPVFCSKSLTKQEAILRRFYLERPMDLGTRLRLSPALSHRLTKVLRLKCESRIRLFNDQSGEFLTRIEDTGKSGVEVTIERKLRSPARYPPLALAFSPLKKTCLDFLIEKATELGVSDFFPMQSAYSQVGHLRPQRWQERARQAVESCERFALPRFHPPQQLSAFLKKPPSGWTLLPLLERSPRLPLLVDWLNARKNSLQSILLMLGPEGGFSAEEAEALQAAPFQAVSLGDVLFRAETAGLAALALVHCLLTSLGEAPCSGDGI